MLNKFTKPVVIIGAVGALAALSACGSQDGSAPSTETATVQPPTEVLDLGERLAGKNSSRLEFTKSGANFVATFPADDDTFAVTIAQDGTASAIEVTDQNGVVVESTPIKYFGSKVIDEALSTGEGASEGSDISAQQAGIFETENHLQRLSSLIPLEQANLIREDVTSARLAAEADDTFGVTMALLSVAQQTFKAIESDLSEDERSELNSRINALAG